MFFGALKRRFSAPTRVFPYFHVDFLYNPCLGKESAVLFFLGWCSWQCRHLTQLSFQQTH